MAATLTDAVPDQNHRQQRKSTGYVTFVLHAHLPYVVNHGTWPHGQDWLHEAAAETYIPLLRVFRELEECGAPLKCNLNLSPILLEQLNHPDFKSGFNRYLQAKIDSARQDLESFRGSNDGHFARLAEFWKNFYEGVQRDFNDRYHQDLIAGFKEYYDRGSIEIITCGATHGYLALLGTDASVRAQVRIGRETHERFFGRPPRGIWLPECAYRPAGVWRFPVPVDNAPESFQRKGVEEILAENGIQFFFVDTHLVESNVLFTPYELMAGDVPVASEERQKGSGASAYVPYYADTPCRERTRVVFFTRDARTGLQVWSGERGYPGDPVYLEFHKKHWPGGHRYWQVTHAKTDLAAKTAYFPEIANSQTAVHAQHFTHISSEVLSWDAPHDAGVTPILTAPFDAELFGHWWFEGPEWLKNVALQHHRPESQVELITCGEWLDRERVTGFVPLPEGSWGRNGTHEVWMNRDTEWTWKQLYPAELAMVDVARSGKWRGNPLGERIAKQLCRTMLLLESSDWQFLITTEHARDYAEKRFHEHLEDFRSLLDTWRKFEANGAISDEARQRLERQERMDSIFPNINPEAWAE
jgi:1,4-alpha-glucan branching enzyme